MKLNKYQLNLLGTIFGTIAGLSGVLITQEVGDRKTVGTVGGVATVLLGVVTQRPANASPTTEDLEEK
jgi:hypothetical protein